MSFPESRPRRLRRTGSLRRMVRETTLGKDNLVFPMFVRPGDKIRSEISSLPGQFHLSADEAVREAELVAKLGVPAVILFGLPAHKDAVGSEAWHPDGVVQKSIRGIKKAVPELTVAVDACFCEYTSHGHCGVILEPGGDKKPGFKDDRGAGKSAHGPDDRSGAPREPTVDNDATLENLARLALSYAEAGADIVAPSGMMDGAIGFMRDALDEDGYEDLILMSYAAKYASAFYGPFRAAADSTPAFGDRRGYQMDPANVREAIREVALDVEEGADIVMVKPALAYLDVIAEVRQEFDVPIAAYNVSGEYAMLEAAAQKGWIDHDRTMLETLVSIRRAGADLILTYHAKDAARLL